MSRTLFLVTGGGGFIGSHVVRALLDRGDAVRVLDDFSTGKRANLAGLTGALEVLEGDVRSASACTHAVRDVAHVLHLAALPSVPRSIADPQASHDVNLNGTFNLLMAARAASVKRFVYSSSSSVYGDSPELPKEEGMRTNPLSPYAVSKLGAEHYCRVFGSLYGMTTVSLRYFNVFGPRQDPNSQYSGVIARFITAMLRGERPTVRGDGKQTRDFTYVANVVSANLLACSAPLEGPLVMNVGAGGRTSLLDLLERLEELLGRKAGPIFVPAQPGDVRDSLASIARARVHLGYEPSVDFASGLKETLDYFKSLT